MGATSPDNLSSPCRLRSGASPSLLAMEAAASVDADTPMGAKAAELYAAFAEAGNAGLDFSAIIKTL